MTSNTEAASNTPKPTGQRLGRLLLAGCASSTVLLGGLALSSGTAEASTPPTVLHFFQKELTLTFSNASGQVIQGYPPVGGHVTENDVDYVGNHSHHAKKWSVTDHLFCNVVSAPATASCFLEFATGGSLIYEDNVTVNLASGSGPLTIDGGTGEYAGYTGAVSSTTVGNTNNSDLVLTLHKQ
ncbi:MAG TPA: hypothetical protein VGG38_18995 [Acidimicrobiales bacterium]|jgi:hypothetical protein